MEINPADRHLELAQPVYFCLVTAPVVAILPVRAQALQIGQVGPVGPCFSLNLIRPAHAYKALVQVLEGAPLHVDAEWSQGPAVLRCVTRSRIDHRSLLLSRPVIPGFGARLVTARF